MVRLKKELFDRIIAHLKGEYPNEGCGLLAGRRGQVESAHPVRNVEASPTSYWMDPREEFDFFRRLREKKSDFLGIYHSHPTSEAYPSERDRSLAFYDEVFYLIVSLKDLAEPVVRVFWIRQGKIKEDKISWSE